MLRACVRTVEAAEFLLSAVQRCVKEKVEQVIFVQHGGGAEALARSLFLEHREMTVTVVDVPETSKQTAAVDCERSDGRIRLY